MSFRNCVHHLKITESQCRHHVVGSDGDVDAIDVDDDADEEQVKEHSPADASRLI